MTPGIPLYFGYWGRLRQKLMGLRRLADCQRERAGSMAQALAETRDAMARLGYGYCPNCKHTKAAEEFLPPLPYCYKCRVDLYD